MASQVNPAAGFPKHHKRCRTIGSGSEATVESWTHQTLGATIAVKIYSQPKNGLPIEVEILKSLPSHKSIVTILAYLPRPSILKGDAVVFEHCPFGDLFELNKNFWVKNGGSLSEACMWSIFGQLTAAIAFLHEGIGCRDLKALDTWRPIIHRDIKIENIFVMSFGHKQDLSDIVIKLGDFGLSAYYDPSNARMPGWFGTTLIWPPEQTWEGREARPAGDVWATGCVIHELAHGFPPVVNPAITKVLLRNKTDYMWASWGQSFQDTFWAAKSERKPLPINLEPELHEYDARRKRPTPKYSDKLSLCMMTALLMHIEQRPTAAALKRLVDEEHAAFLYEELMAENEALLMEDAHGDDEIDGWF